MCCVGVCVLFGYMAAVSPGRRCGLVVCLLHGDVHDSHVISQLCHVISSTIEVNPIPPSLQAGELKCTYIVHTCSLYNYIYNVCTCTCVC